MAGEVRCCAGLGGGPEVLADLCTAWRALWGPRDPPPNAQLLWQEGGSLGVGTAVLQKLDCSDEGNVWLFSPRDSQ